MKLRWRRFSGALRAGGGLPIFWQTLILVLSAIIFAQSISVLMFFLNPPPRPQFNRLLDIAAVLQGQKREPNERERPLQVRLQPAAPAAPSDMVSDATLTHALAERLGVDDRHVRLYFQPDRIKGGEPFRRWPRDPIAVRHGETLFFTPLVTALETSRGWRVAATPAPPFISRWQRRLIAWLLISAIALTPVVWMFARALTRPIRRFAEAAERMGADPGAPPVAEEGPAELRTTARAINTMQSRLIGYVGERTEMIGAIAHDLRTPLARIAFRIEAAPESMRDKVLADVEQMRAMLAATIAFVRGTGQQQRVEMDLAALLRAIADQDRDLGRPVTLGPIAAARISGDPLMIERLFQNLIDNGIAYGGGVRLSLEPKEGRALIRVADRGPGLSEDMLSRAFQPFARGEPSRNRATGGIGLGLSIARTIVEQHGGTITLANRRGGGLEATVSLPLAG